jgi:hypothetical protein
VQHDAVRGREAVPRRVKVRAVVRNAHLREDAAQIATPRGIPRARPASRIRAFLRLARHIAVGSGSESFVIARAPCDERKRHAEYGTEEVLHLKDDDLRARHSLAGKWNGAG